MAKFKKTAAKKSARTTKASAQQAEQLSKTLSESAQHCHRFSGSMRLGKDGRKLVGRQVAVRDNDRLERHTDDLSDRHSRI